MISSAMACDAWRTVARSKLAMGALALWLTETYPWALSTGPDLGDARS